MAQTLARLAKIGRSPLLHAIERAVALAVIAVVLFSAL